MSSKKPSKFRHIFAKARSQAYDDISVGSASQESSIISASSKFFAVPWKQGNGNALVVWPLEKKGRTTVNTPQGSNLLFGHEGKITDFSFSPFHDDLLVTASEDSTLKLWKIQEQEKYGVKLTSKDFAAEFIGHNKKVNAVTFHPTVNNLMISLGNDKTVKIWDLQSQKEHLSYTFNDGTAFNVSWCHDGSLFTSAVSDKNFHVVDPRAGKSIQKVDTNLTGFRGFRALWKGQNERIITSGFSKSSERQIQQWDLKNLSTPISSLNVDSSACNMIPTFDETLNILFVGGRGEATIKCYEVGDQDIEFLTTHNCSSALNGLTPLHKVNVNVRNNELLNFLTVTNKSVTFVDFFAPRKSEYFQDDLYPLLADNVPSLDLSEWLSGETQTPKMISLKPDDMKAQSEVGPIEQLKPKYDFKEEQAKQNQKNTHIESFEKIGSIDKFIAYNNMDEEEGQKRKPTPIDDDW